MATHSSVLAWRIPGTGEPRGLPSLESHRVGHDWSDLAAAALIISGHALLTNQFMPLSLCAFIHEMVPMPAPVSWEKPRESFNTGPTAGRTYASLDSVIHTLFWNDETPCVSYVTSPDESTIGTKVNEYTEGTAHSPWDVVASHNVRFGVTTIGIPMAAWPGKHLKLSWLQFPHLWPGK